MALTSRSGTGDDRRVINDDLHVRRVRPDDAGELERLYAGLSDSTRRLRFHRDAQPVTRRDAAAFATVDHRHRDGFVAVHGSHVVGHLALEPRGDGVDEIAVVVDDRSQRRGVGTLLLAAGLASARLRGIRWVVAWVAAENRAARRLLEGTRHDARRFWEGRVARYEIQLPPVTSIAGRR